ncbi:hypothetical protein DL762_004655 [Monosporascus cannonballus]|uniref:Uncharacterized protein n=1 Tax=Monosporascus cannonballus TaxID=155416 RepID=A0ABY0H7P5_9PEZI|nr:hypothetical protein DL762_004655 [Monosporascus cannonballus]
MIRQHLQAALVRTRPDINRATDGIASSLRHFSVAQRLTSSENNDNNASSRRQRDAKAVDELIAMGETAVNQIQSPDRSQDQPRPFSGAAPSPSQPSNIISVKSLPRGGFQGIRRYDPGAGRTGAPPSTGNTGGLGAGPVIRGGFRGRGGRTVGGAGGAGGVRGGRGGARRRRPARSEEDEAAAAREKAEDEYYVSKEEREWFAARAEGVERPFQPQLTLESLAGYGPAVATSGTPFARGETVIRQARVLGGGRPYHEDDRVPPEDALRAFREGTGVFFATPEAKEWTRRFGSRKATFGAPPEETRQAVLEAALLGKYDGPRYAEPADTIATVRNYVKRDNSWYAAGERALQEKIESLLPDGRGGA